MKLLLFSAALALSGAALAQAPEPAPAPPPDTSATQPGTVPDSTATPPPGAGVTQQGTVPSGIATPPPGTNEPPTQVPAGTPMPDQSAAFTPQAAPTEYPPCSRTVTDRCIQTYEKKGRRR
jgi:hypothetical protein